MMQSGSHAPRIARGKDLVAMREVERSANRTFAHVGMTILAEADPPPLRWFESYQADGRAWVVADDEDVPIAYLLADVVDGFAHVKEIAVHPDFQRRGIGRMLLEHVAHWARTWGSTRLTLTTFRDVPWNAPYYERCGFRELRDDELTPALHDTFEEETRQIAKFRFDRSSRVYMGRDLHDAD
jgi:GNAT superfamily N-acetyltransferase